MLVYGHFLVTLNCYRYSFCRAHSALNIFISVPTKRRMTTWSVKNCNESVITSLECKYDWKSNLIYPEKVPRAIFPCRGDLPVIWFLSPRFPQPACLSWSARGISALNLVKADWIHSRLFEVYQSRVYVGFSTACIVWMDRSSTIIFY